jgi:hypothetical protein
MKPMREKTVVAIFKKFLFGLLVSLFGVMNGYGQQLAFPVVGSFQIPSFTMSSTSQTRSESPAAIAGVTRKV